MIIKVIKELSIISVKVRVNHQKRNEDYYV